MMDYLINFFEVIKFRRCFSNNMSTLMATILLLGDLISWFFYYIERNVVKKNHKKFIKKKKILYLHIITGIIETILGYWAIISNEKHFIYYTAYVSLIHVLTTFPLIPNVWGLKYITIPGYLIVSFMRLFEICCIFFNSNKIYHLQNLWILLHTATLVRILSYYIYPWSSKNGKYGDLSVNPVIYTGSVSTAALICTIYVYDPFIVFIVLGILFLAKLYFGHPDIILDTHKNIGEE